MASATTQAILLVLLTIHASNLCLAQQGTKPRNPFGFPDVQNPNGNDVAAFAASTRFSKDARDANAAMWTSKSVRGVPGSVSGKWASRWAGKDGKWVTGEALVVEKENRVYIFYKDEEAHYLIDTRRDGDRLSGRTLNTRDPSDSTLWVGDIVGDDRIDGAWRGGRWDLRRKLASAKNSVLPSADSGGKSFAEQIGFARQHLRNGTLEKSATMVRASLSRQPLPSTGDDRDLALAKALVAYADGNLRATYNEVSAIHLAQKPGPVNTDGGLLKSLVFVQQGVLPLAAYWHGWAATHAGDSLTVKTLADLLASKGVVGTTYNLERTLPFEGHEGYSIDVWRGHGSPLQETVFVFRTGSDFRAAFAVEAQTSEEKVKTYELRFYDLERDSIHLQFYGSVKPSDDDVLKLAKHFSPVMAKDGYTLVRSEVEAIRWHRSDVAPYAVLWAGRAAGSQLVSQSVEKPLKETLKFSWDSRGHETFQAADNSQLDLRVFVNSELPNLDAWKDIEKRADVETKLKDKGALEHFHLIINAAGSRTEQYFGSAVLESIEPRSGVRIYYLSLIIDGARRRLRRYDDPLSLAQLIETTKQLLRNPEKPGT